MPQRRSRKDPGPQPRRYLGADVPGGVKAKHSGDDFLGRGSQVRREKDQANRIPEKCPRSGIETNPLVVSDMIKAKTAAKRSAGLALIV